MTYSSPQMRRSFARQRRDIRWIRGDTVVLFVSLGICLWLFIAAWKTWLNGLPA